MATLFVKRTSDVDGMPIQWQRDYEFCLESEDWTDEYNLCEYTIPDADTPAWLEQALDTNPDVISYWIAQEED